MFRTFIRNLDPAVFFIPGLFGVPLGGLYGAYHGISETKNKNLIVNVANFTMYVATGSVVGGIVGTIWPISFTSFALVNTMYHTKANNLPLEFTFKK